MNATANPRAAIGGNEPPIKDRLELEHAALLKEATEAAALVPDQIRAIQTDEEAGDYADTAISIKKMIERADAAFEAEKKPWRDGAKVVDDFFAFRKALTSAVARVRSALDARANLLLALQRKAEALAAEKARKEAEAFDEPIAWVPPAPVRDVARVASASGAKASAGTKWVAEVVEIDKLPRHYMLANQTMIDAAVKGGIREIPGVRIYETAKTSLRR